MPSQDFIFFYQQFAKEKLAKHLDIDSSEIKHLSINDPSSPHDLEYNGQRYIAKIARPGLASKYEKALIWDFDVRGDKWENGRNIKVGRPAGICDFYILIGIKNNIADRVFLIPFDESPASHVRISVEGISKYSRFEI